MPPIADWMTSWDISHGEPVARDGGAVDLEIQIVAAHDALGVDAERAGHAANDVLDSFADAFKLVEVGAGDLDADGRFDAGRKHIECAS